MDITLLPLPPHWREALHALDGLDTALAALDELNDAYQPGSESFSHVARAVFAVQDARRYLRAVPAVVAVDPVLHITVHGSGATMEAG